MGQCGCVDRSAESTGQTPRLILSGRLTTPKRVRSAHKLLPDEDSSKKESLDKESAGGSCQGNDENTSPTIPIKRADGSPPISQRRAHKVDIFEDVENQSLVNGRQSTFFVEYIKCPALNLTSNSGSNAVPLSEIAHRVFADISNKSENPASLDELPSKGSTLHHEGQCKRCCFFPRGRCQNGSSCDFCHFEHEKRSHRKRKKGKCTDLEVGVDDDLNDTECDTDIPVTPESFNDKPFPTSGDIKLPAESSISWGLNKEGASKGPKQTNVEGGRETKASWKRMQKSACSSAPSMLCTVPVTTQQLTNALPVFTSSRVAPKIVRKVEGILHQWHDAGDRYHCWQPAGSIWPVIPSQWGAHQPPEHQAWEWTEAIELHPDQFYHMAWNESSPVDETMPNPTWSCGTGDIYFPTYASGAQNLAAATPVSTDSECNVVVHLPNSGK